MRSLKTLMYNGIKYFFCLCTQTAPCDSVLQTRVPRAPAQRETSAQLATGPGPQPCPPRLPDTVWPELRETRPSSSVPTAAAPSVSQGAVLSVVWTRDWSHTPGGGGRWKGASAGLRWGQQGSPRRLPCAAYRLA